MTPDEVTDGHAEWRDVLIIQGGEYHACLCPENCGAGAAAFFLDAGVVTVSGPALAVLPAQLAGDTWTLFLPAVDDRDEVLVSARGAGDVRPERPGGGVLTGCLGRFAERV